MEKPEKHRMTIRRRIDSAARFALFGAVVLSGGQGSLVPIAAEDAAKAKVVLKNRKT